MKQVSTVQTKSHVLMFHLKWITWYASVDRDETIHLFSLQTGTKVWVRPAPIKREYGFRN